MGESVHAITKFVKEYILSVIARESAASVSEGLREHCRVVLATMAINPVITEKRNET